MPRVRSPEREKAKELYLNAKGNIKLIDIAQQLGVLDTQIRKWKSQDKWDNELKGKGTLPKEKEQTKSNVTNGMSWVDIENEYVTDIRKKPCTLEELAEKYNIAVGTVEKYSMDNRWSDKRKKYQKNLKQKYVEKTADIISNDIAAYKAKHLNISDKVLNEIKKALNNEDELYTIVEKIRTGTGKGEFEEEIVEERLNTINDAKVLNLVNAMDKLQKMQRQTLNILDPKEAIKEEKENNTIEINNKPFELPAKLIAPCYIETLLDIKDKGHREYILKGGRGSAKSSFVSEIIIDLLKNNPQMHAVVMRKVKDTLRDSVYSQMMWAISALELENEFKCSVSPMEITYIPTGQKIYFRGLDEPTKLKGIKPTFGYVGIAWFNLRNSDHIKPFKFGETLTA